MRIIETLKEKNSAIPTVVELFYKNLEAMGQPINVFNFLPVINITRTLSVCQSMPISPVRSFGLFGNENKLTRSSAAEEMPAKKPRPRITPFGLQS